ncbi:phenylalanine--tRNA ligase subunit beta [Candidatus Woesearchaeota archaeon]|nr:phenylalanine--tRNA ligase subunit beta [Candidatus Woesearchaeota archaeon]
MPTITFSLKDLQELVGKKLTPDEVGRLVEFGKGEMKQFTKETDEVTVDFDDTNLPYLWSVEGVARLFRGVLGMQKGFSRVTLKKGEYSIIVDESVESVRPFVAGMVVKGKKIDERLLKQLIQLQEKLCESYGKRRSKVAMGIYPFDKITFPVHYRAVKPESARFVPLDFSKEMSLGEILEEHPKGKEYAFILKGKQLYPLLADSKGKALSFPPIINSAETGKINIGEERFFVEVTGTDREAAELCLNIAAYALSERGFEVYGVIVVQGNKKTITPSLQEEKIKVPPEHVKQLFGLELGKGEIKTLLEKAGFEVNSSGTVIVPPYRRDILHAYDVVEDIGIMHGYESIGEKALISYTAGGTSPKAKLSNLLRELAIGLGFQEVMSPVLSNKGILHTNMSLGNDAEAWPGGFSTIEIENFMSETYSSVRSWLTPILMEFLSKNNHVGYPQKIFEIGTASVQQSGKAIDHEKIAFAAAHEKAGYTEVRQILDYIMRMLNIPFTVEEIEHGSFIPGRAGAVIAHGKTIALLGEIHPKVLTRWGIIVPVAAVEINVGEILIAGMATDNKR